MGIMKWLNGLFGNEEVVAATGTEGANGVGAMSSNASNAASAPMVSLPMDEAEKNLVAVIASCIVGKDHPDAQLHIERITRIQ
jgi:hypothetical protein